MNFFRKIVTRKKRTNKEFQRKVSKLLGFKPNDLSFYEKAFTHKSSGVVDSNGITVSYERLEFLGDAILGAVIASYLYKTAPKKSEGYLTQMRSKVVSRNHLNKLGKKLHLISLLKNNLSKNQISENIHGNIFEALIGAIYLDKGYNYCYQFIYKNVIKKHLDIDQLEQKITSYKGLIIEWCQKQKKQYQFDTYEDTGNETTKHFSVKISIDNQIVGKGRSTSKKKAEEIAAKRTYFKLQEAISSVNNK